MPAPLTSGQARCWRYEKVEGRAVIGDGAPFDAQSRSLGVQGWNQAAALSKLENVFTRLNTVANKKLRAPRSRAFGQGGLIVPAEKL